MVKQGYQDQGVCNHFCRQARLCF